MRVAIVDDHSGIRTVLRALLGEHHGIEVVGEATDGDEVLEMVSAVRPDLVVMDYSMARVNGLTATSELRSSHPSVDVVAFTSTSDATIIHGFLALGVTRHFDKTDIDALIEYVAARAAAS